MMQRSLILAGLIGAFTAPVAATPYMSATLDMTTFRQSVIDTDPNDGIEASFVDQFNGRTAIACVALPLPAYCTEDVPMGGMKYTLDRNETVQTGADVPGLRASATAGPALMESVLEGERGSGAHGARAWDVLGLSFSGAGRYTAQVDFQLNLLDFMDRYPAGDALVGMYMSNIGNLVVRQLVTEPGTGDQTLAGTLTLTHDFFNGEQQGMLIYAWAETVDASGPPLGSPVPEPATWSLAFAGLAFVLQRVRRRGQA